MNTNSSDYNTAVKELNIAISQAKTSGDIATMQAIQTYAIQLAQQLYQEARDAVADRQWELSYALQKAAFDLEHAAQTGSNSNYYNSGSYSYPGWDYPGTETEEVINPEDSEATSEIIQSKLKDLNRYLVGSDFKERASLLISEYSGNLTDTDLESLANSCGMTTDEMDQYVMAYLR